MIKYILIIFLMISVTLFGQNINKDHFQIMVASTYTLIENFEKSEFEELSTFLKLDPLEREKLNTSLSQKIIKDSVFTSPHYYLTNKPNIFEVKITSFKVLEKSDKEKFNRGEYYFVIETMVEIDPQSEVITFFDSKININQDEIKSWWLSQFKSYVSKTKKVHEKYEYVPPPPPAPPFGLK